jgi:hypothetical protein
MTPTLLASPARILWRLLERHGVDPERLKFSSAEFAGGDWSARQGLGRSSPASALQEGQSSVWKPATANPHHYAVCQDVRLPDERSPNETPVGIARLLHCIKQPLTPLYSCVFDVLRRKLLPLRVKSRTFT